MATASLTHKYIPRVEQTEENTFMEEYYSSTDVKIFIEEENQTEISYISYSLQEQLKPLYGYASRTFDDVAVGNRIVTGMLKIPIKNPDAQSSLREIENQGGVPVPVNYNDKQDDLMENIDWITGPNKPAEQTITVQGENPVNSEYVTKLINLGYDLDYNATSEVYTREIKKFQTDNNIDSTGNLTTQTMDAINKKLLQANPETTLFLQKGTKIYVGPEITFSNFVLKENETVTILNDKYNNGWVHVMTKDSTEGYVNNNEL